jgi:hypothetical protein
MKLTAIVVACAMLSGCATTYTFDGKRYSSKEEMLAGADQALANAANSIQPLSAPVASRSLLFAIPSEKTAIALSAATFEANSGRMIGLGEQIILSNITTANTKAMRALHEVIKRRNLYPSLRYVELDTTTADLQASASEDVLYWTETTRQGSGQWYYVTAKSGKQVFAFDRGGADMNARTKAFVDALQSFALRD